VWRKGDPSWVDAIVEHGGVEGSAKATLPAHG
jgi:hypothetical protein